MKKLLALLLSLLFLLPLLMACGNTPTEEDTTKSQETTKSQAEEEKIAEEKMQERLLSKISVLTDLCYNNFLDIFWSEDLGYFLNYYKGGFRCTTNDLIWEYFNALNALETYYDATKDERVLEIVQKEYDAIMNSQTEENLLKMNGGANPAVDDTAGTIGLFLLVYRLLHIEKALDYAHTLFNKVLDFYADGDTAHGLWYCYFTDEQVAHEGDNEMKTLSNSAILVYFGLLYDDYTKGTSREDAELQDKLFDLYLWIEKIGRRAGQTFDGYKQANDGLYYNSCLILPTTGDDAPKGYNRLEEDFVKECYSHSGLSMNMYMAVVNKKMYDKTGISVYLKKAVQTANSLNSKFYNYNGIYLNDGDAWVNCQACRQFIEEVMPLDGIDKELGKMFIRTSLSIMKYAYYEEGFLGADWYGLNNWEINENYGNPLWITTDSNTLNMIFATLLALKKGVVHWDEDFPTFPDTYQPLPLPSTFVSMKKQYDSSWGKKK